MAIPMHVNPRNHIVCVCVKYVYNYVPMGSRYEWHTVPIVDNRCKYRFSIYLLGMSF